MRKYREQALRAKTRILALPRLVKQVFIGSIDIACAYLSVWFGYLIRLDSFDPLTDGGKIVFITSCVTFLPIFIGLGLYRAIFRYAGWLVLTTMSRAIFLYSAFIFLIFSVYGVDGVPRSIGILQPLIFFLLIGSCRAIIRYTLNDLPLGSSKEESRFLIVGINLASRRFASIFKDEVATKICAYIDDSLEFNGTTLDGINVYGLDKVSMAITSHHITDVLIANQEISSNKKEIIIGTAAQFSVKVRFLPSAEYILPNLLSSPLIELNDNDLLGRQVVKPYVHLMDIAIKEKVVMVTGAGGSIGSELARQILRYSPSRLILLDVSEAALYIIYEELKAQLDKISSEIQLNAVIGSVTNQNFIEKLISKWLPNTIYHAAAYKHVPLVEANVCSGVLNNVYGTLYCAQMAAKYMVDNFVLISTDKAVRPTNVMGASKRLAENIVQGISAEIKSTTRNTDRTVFSIVRFGNVIGSSGSVIPIFKKQIKEGGPVTVTDFHVNRYFMSIPEAAELVLQTSGLAKGGDLFILNMGDPIFIYELAKRMIGLSGKTIKDDSNPNGDIEIKIIGLRSGEKLYEELLISAEPMETVHPKILVARESYTPFTSLKLDLDDMQMEVEKDNPKGVLEALERMLSEYTPLSESVV